MRCKLVILCVFEAVEEDECWRQYEALRARTNQHTAAEDVGFHGNRTTSSRTKCAHMDVVRPRDSEHSAQSTFWQRRFDAAESTDPNRLYHTSCTSRNWIVVRHCNFFFV